MSINVLFRSILYFYLEPCLIMTFQSRPFAAFDLALVPTSAQSILPGLLEDGLSRLCRSAPRVAGGAAPGLDRWRGGSPNGVTRLWQIPGFQPGVLTGVKT